MRCVTTSIVFFLILRIGMSRSWLRFVDRSLASVRKSFDSERSLDTFLLFL